MRLIRSSRVDADHEVTIVRQRERGRRLSILLRSSEEVLARRQCQWTDIPAPQLILAQAKRLWLRHLGCKSYARVPHSRKGSKHSQIFRTSRNQILLRPADLQASLNPLDRIRGSYRTAKTGPSFDRAAAVAPHMAQIQRPQGQASRREPLGDPKRATRQTSPEITT